MSGKAIALLRARDVLVRWVARRLRRSPSTISRELRRNAATRGGRLDYRAGIAQWKAELMARRRKAAKLAENDQLHVTADVMISERPAEVEGRAVPGHWESQCFCQAATGVVGSGSR